MRRCKRCHELHDRVGKRGRPALFCAPCRKRNDAEAALRYDRSPKGKAAYRRSYTPRRKILMAAWVDAHLEQVRVKKREWARAHRVARVVQCATVLCMNTFVRRGQQGRKTYCDECAVVFFGPANARRRQKDVAA